VAYRDLREFVRKLEKEAELTRVRTEVDPILEITEIVQRVGRGRRNAASKHGSGKGARPEMAVPHDGVGPALLFERPRGSRVPLLVNAFGSVRRMCLAFEVGALEEVAGRIRGFLDM
jgi:4-hydroxy-3-polyprenylbenzoate decarboxylase